MEMTITIVNRTDTSAAADLLTQIIDVIADRTVAKIEERYHLEWLEGQPGSHVIVAPTEEGPQPEAAQEPVQEEVREVATEEPRADDARSKRARLLNRIWQLYQLSRTHFNGYRWIAGDVHTWREAMNIVSSGDVPKLLSRMQADGWIVVEKQAHRDGDRIAVRPTPEFREWMKGRGGMMLTADDLKKAA
jgi:hypothetical protein